MLKLIRLNLTIGLLAFALNFIFSYKQNVISTVLFRSLLAFFLFFLLTFVIQFLFKLFTTNHHVQDDQTIHKGKNIDLKTPETTEMIEEEKEFIPLAQTIQEKTPSLNHDPSHIANAIRKVMNND